MTKSSVQFSETDTMLCCRFSGRFDGFVCDEIEQDILQNVDKFKSRGETIQIIFDLSEVVYISSAFLRICLICHRNFGGNCFSIVNTSEAIYNVFHISGFAEIMNVTPSLPTQEFVEGVP